jgi:hypothetical protein
MPIRILYGTKAFSVNVTKSLNPLSESNVLYIPAGDINRCTLFGIDPVYGELKYVYVYDSNSIEHEFDDSYDIFIDEDIIYTQRNVPSELEKKDKSLPMKSITFGQSPSIQDILISNSFERIGNNLEILYVIKKTNIESNLIKTQNNNTKNLTTHSQYDTITHAGILSGYKQIGTKLWREYINESLNYIVRGNILIDSLESVDIINEIEKHFTSIESRGVNDLGSTEIWIQQPVEKPILATKSNNNLKKYIRKNGYIVCSE